MILFNVRILSHFYRDLDGVLAKQRGYAAALAKDWDVTRCVTDQAAQQAVVEELGKRGVTCQKFHGLAGAIVVGVRPTGMAASRRC